MASNHMTNDTLITETLQKPEGHSVEECNADVMAIRDTLYALNGKWKLPLIMSLATGPRRFTDIQRSLGDITPKILSKELRELEMNMFIERQVFSTTPVTVTYQLTPYSASLRPVLDELATWGKKHRQKIMPRHNAVV